MITPSQRHRSARPKSAKKFTIAEIEEALRKTAGLLHPAAVMLKCSRQTVANYVGGSKRLQEVRTELTEMTLDLAETKLFAAIQQGELKAVIYYLDRFGRKRGYTLQKDDNSVTISGASGSKVVLYLPKERAE